MSLLGCDTDTRNERFLFTDLTTDDYSFVAEEGHSAAFLEYRILNSEIAESDRLLININPDENQISTYEVFYEDYITKHMVDFNQTFCASEYTILCPMYMSENDSGWIDVNSWNYHFDCLEESHFHDETPRAVTYQYCPNENCRRPLATLTCTGVYFSTRESYHQVKGPKGVPWPCNIVTKVYWHKIYCRGCKYKNSRYAKHNCIQTHSSDYCIKHDDSGSVCGYK